MAKINGTSMSITIEGTTIDCVVDATLETSRNLFDTSCKDDLGWATHGQGQGSGSVSGNARVDFSATMGYQELVALLIDRTAIDELIFTSDTVGGLVVTCAASVASLTFNAPNEDSATFDFTFTINGAIVATVLT